MPRKKSTFDVQFAVRLPEEWLKRADELSESVGRFGMMATRTDVIRIAIYKGLEALEKERGPKPKKGATKK